MASEYLRQFLHLLFGSAIILILLFLGKSAALLFCTTALVFALALSHLVKNGATTGFLQKITENSVRPSEKNFPMRGPVTFCTGIILATIISQTTNAALGAAIILVFGDGFSTLAGKKFGKIRLTDRHTLEGTLGGIMVSFAILASFLEIFPALFASTIAMLSELSGLEDNITIPVTAAIVLSLII